MRWLMLNKLYAYQKAYFLKMGMKKMCYSQFGEDIAINRFFSNQKKGFFVDVGCFHPIKYNNTWQLYKKGWRGINIDIDSIKIDVFNIRRPEDTNISCAVSDMDEEIDYYSDGKYSLTTTVDKDFSDARGGYVKKRTISRSLNSILDNSIYSASIIDFLSIDAEGNDLNVLKSLDFNTYTPRLVAVECPCSILTDVIKSEVYNFLSNLGYCMVGWYGLTLIMSNELPHYNRS